MFPAVRPGLARRCPLPALALAAMVAAALVVPGGVDGGSALAVRDAAGRAPAVGVAEPSPERAALIREVQEMLSRLGLYRGPADGRGSPALREAVVRWQRSHGRPATGDIDAALVKTLSDQVEVKRMEGQLRRRRDHDTAAAARALASSPVLAALRAAAPAATAGAPQACYRTPTVDCLLTIAADAARRVEKAELRDWARADIAASLARADRLAEAGAVVTTIEDPRSIMVALQAMALAQATAGRWPAAQETAVRIPDSERRAEALVAIASTLAKGEGPDARHHHDPVQAAAALAAAETAVAGLPQADQRLLTQLGVAAARNGDRDRARALFDQAWRAAPHDDRRPTLATAMADAGNPDAALALIKAGPAGRVGTAPQGARGNGVRGDGASAALPVSPLGSSARYAAGVADPDPVYVAVSAALARRGEFDAARAQAESVAGDRYRAVAFAALAAEAARSGRQGETETALAAARTSIDGIALPFARAYAENRVVLALLAAGHPAEALTLALAIRDPSLRAEALSAVAVARPPADDIGRRARVDAEASVKAVLDPVLRTRALCALANDLRAGGDIAGGRRTLDRAVAMAGDLAAPWQKVRALLAVTDTLTAFGPDAQ